MLIVLDLYTSKLNQMMYNEFFGVHVAYMEGLKFVSLNINPKDANDMNRDNGIAQNAYRHFKRINLFNTNGIKDDLF